MYYNNVYWSQPKFSLMWGLLDPGISSKSPFPIACMSYRIPHHYHQRHQTINIHLLPKPIDPNPLLPLSSVLNTVPDAPRPTLEAVANSFQGIAHRLASATGDSGHRLSYTAASSADNSSSGFGYSGNTVPKGASHEGDGVVVVACHPQFWGVISSFDVVDAEVIDRTLVLLLDVQGLYDVLD